MKKPSVAIFGVGIVTMPVLANLLRHLSEHFSITLYSFTPVEQNLVPPGIRLRTVGGEMHMRLKYVLLSVRFLFDHLFLQYRILHAQSAFPGGVIARFLGRTLRIPWMVTLIGGETEDMPEIPFGDLRNKKLHPITMKVCSEATRLIVMSHEQARLTKQHLHLTRSIDVLGYSPEIALLRTHCVQSPLELVHVSVYHPVKNYEMLLATILRLSKMLPVKLIIAGGNFPEAFHQRLIELGLQDTVTMKGKQSYENTLQLIRNTDILVHTSYYESMPTVAFEAMASGVVVCGTRVGIIADLSEQCCIAVDVNDADGLATTIVRVATDNALYQQLRMQAYQWASEHDPVFYVDTLSAWYRDAMR